MICVECAPTTEMLKVKFLLFKELNLIWESENQIGFLQIASKDKKHSTALRGHRCTGWGAFLSHLGDGPGMPQTKEPLCSIQEASKVCSQRLTCARHLKCHGPVGKVRLLFSLSRSRVTERLGVLSKATQMINCSLEFDPREEGSSCYSLWPLDRCECTGVLGNPEEFSLVTVQGRIVRESRRNGKVRAKGLLWFDSGMAVRAWASSPLAQASDSIIPFGCFLESTAKFPQRHIPKKLWRSQEITHLLAFTSVPIPDIFQKVLGQLLNPISNHLFGCYEPLSSNCWTTARVTPTPAAVIGELWCRLLSSSLWVFSIKLKTKQNKKLEKVAQISKDLSFILLRILVYLVRVKIYPGEILWKKIELWLSWENNFVCE